MPTQMNRRSLLQGAALSPMAVAALPQKSTGTIQGDYLKPLWLQRRGLISLLSSLDQAWLDARSRLPHWCLPGPKYLTDCGKGIVGWPAAKSPIVLCNGRILLRPSPKDLRELFYEDTHAFGSDAARLVYRARSKALRARLTEQRLLERDARLPRSSDWLAIEKDIRTVERAILTLRLDSNTVAARLLIAFRNQGDKSATGEDELLSHLRSILEAYLTDEIANLNGYILEDLQQIFLDYPNC